MKLSQVEQLPYHVMLFASRSGHGKSTAIASYAELGGLYVLDLDKRARGMLGSPAIKREWLDRIEVDQSIDASQGFAEIDKKLEIKLIKAKSRQLDEKTIAIESFGTLVKTLLFDSMRLRGAEDSFRGKSRGSVKFFHPDDYNYVSMAVNQLVYTCLLQLKVNLILSGWIVDRYGKPAGSDDYAQAEVIGQKMLGPANLAEEIVGYFDEVYLFEKEETGSAKQPLKFTVSFEGNLAKTSIPELHGWGKVDVTNKSFLQVYTDILTGKMKR